MIRTSPARRLGLSLVPLAVTFATPCLAGMTQDLADCTAADRKTSAAACTRVMESGRLPRAQFYIGHYNRGWSYFNAGDYDKALADFDSSIKYNPGYADTYFSRAVVQHERGEREKSRADLDLYLEKKGEVSAAHLNRAMMFRRRAELDQAFSELRRAAALDPGSEKVLVLRALVLSDRGEQGPARTEAEKALATKPDDAGALYARALVSFREQKFDDATADVEKALARKDAFPAAHTLMGRILEQRADPDGAEKHYRRALEIPSKSVDARAAHEEARERLAALTGKSPAKVAASAAAPGKESDCRRFIPSAAITIVVDCSE
jgi:Tfp pilus assembly protein PilF